MFFYIQTLTAEVDIIALTEKTKSEFEIDEDSSLTEEMIYLLAAEYADVFPIPMDHIKEITDIKDTGGVNRGSANKCIFKVETRDGKKFIIKEVAHPIQNTRKRESTKIALKTMEEEDKSQWTNQQYTNHKNMQLSVTSPEEELHNLDRLMANEKLKLWNTRQSQQPPTVWKLKVNIPLKLIKIKIGESEDEYIYIEVLECASGQSFNDVVLSFLATHTQIETELEEIKKYFYKLGQMLATFHEETGLIHGDLNLGNILLDPETSTLTLIDIQSMAKGFEKEERGMGKEPKAQLIDFNKIEEYLERMSIMYPETNLLLEEIKQAFLGGYTDSLNPNGLKHIRSGALTALDGSLSSSRTNSRSSSITSNTPPPSLEIE